MTLRRFAIALPALLFTACASQRNDVVETAVRPERMERASEQVAHEPGAISNLVPAGEREVMTVGGRFIVRYRTSPDPIPLNDLFDLDVQVLDGESGRIITGPLQLRVDGRMPHHRHGMMTRPVVMRKADGGFSIEGMQFHMPGRWELHLDVVDGRLTERAQDVIFVD